MGEDVGELLSNPFVDPQDIMVGKDLTEYLVKRQATVKFICSIFKNPLMMLKMASCANVN